MTEHDPNGLQPGAPGAKLDAEKPPVMQGVLHYFPRALRALATVSEVGAMKYSWGGYRTVPDGITRYGNAGARHILDEATEGHYDGQTELLHAAQIAWNYLARLELMLEAGVPLRRPSGTPDEI